MTHLDTFDIWTKSNVLLMTILWLTYSAFIVWYATYTAVDEDEYNG